VPTTELRAALTRRKKAELVEVLMELAEGLIPKSGAKEIVIG
jgi:hypothetical protein